MWAAHLRAAAIGETSCDGMRRARGSWRMRANGHRERRLAPWEGPGGDARQAAVHWAQVEEVAREEGAWAQPLGTASGKLP